MNYIYPFYKVLFNDHYKPIKIIKSKKYFYNNTNNIKI